MFLWLSEQMISVSWSSNYFIRGLLIALSLTILIATLESE